MSIHLQRAKQHMKKMIAAAKIAEKYANETMPALRKQWKTNPSDSTHNKYWNSHEVHDNLIKKVTDAKHEALWHLEKHLNATIKKHTSDYYD